MFKKIILFSIVSYLVISGANIFAGSKKDFGDFDTKSIINFEYTMSPELPKPNQLTNIKLQSYNFDINASKIFYYINDKLIKSGTGMNSFIFSAPDSGEKMILTIIVKNIKNKIYKKDIIIRPIDATLVYELEDAYKPYFYKGKAYALSNSQVKFKAFTDFIDGDGKYINEDELIYTWYVNYKIQNSKSGYGKKIFTIERLDAYPIETRVEVLVTDSKKTNQARSALILKPKETVVDFYQGSVVEPFKFKNILTNGTFSFIGLDGRIIAIPYFMDGISDPHQPVFYDWRLNGQKILKNRNGDRNSIYLATNAESPKKSGTIKLEIVNKVRPLQSYSGSFRIKFADTDSSQDKQSQKVFNQSNMDTLEKDNNSFFGLFNYK